MENAAVENMADVTDDNRQEHLRILILQTLVEQGYELKDNELKLTENGKQGLRRAHALAVRANIGRAEPALRLREKELLSYIANGNEIVPEKIHPLLVKVEPNTELSYLFRYASLHWSIPISNGYGRRLRFVVLDRHNGKLIGIIGLGDPVFSLKARDEWIGWNFEQRRQRLFHVMDAFVLGAVPPYAHLLFGKFIAMVATSREVRQAFRERYTGRETVIRRRIRDADLALITTTSALGRSSIYNRLKFQCRPLFRSVGYTSGWGTFHFSNGIYNQLLSFAYEKCKGTAKAKGWGGGEFRNRQEVVRKVLQTLGLSKVLMLHQIHREIFVAPLATNTQEFLCGRTEQIDYWDDTLETYFEFFRERWMLPRLNRDRSYQNFQQNEWLLYSNKPEEEVSHVGR